MSVQPRPLAARWILRPRPFPIRMAAGLSLAELLTYLSISSLLLAGLATTFLAGFASYRDGMERGGMLSLGRTFLSGITRDVRMADLHQPYDLNGSVSAVLYNQFISGIVPGSPNSGLSGSGGSGISGIQMTKTHSDSQDPSASVATPVTIRYWYDATKQSVMTSRQVGNNAAVTNVACTCVQGLQLYLQPIYIPYDPSTGSAAYWALERAVVSVTMGNWDATGQKILTNAGQTMTLVLTDAAMPRHGFLTR